MAEIIFYFLSLTSIFKISWQSSVQYRNATSNVPGKLHSNNVTMDATHCSSNIAACHGYIKKMMVFYKSTGGWIMLAIVLLGISCLVISYVRGNLLKRRYYKSANKKVLWSFQNRNPYERKILKSDKLQNTTASPAPTCKSLFKIRSVQLV
ncbi:uncharacterized protein LOC130654842 [Hydractinia symbiolongicarpus]|uniref:uncharacterized protein LOC130654842 n=1 Tax=Hydractinia symbiolongicarpus TaxID=13093 RepID=UPI002551A686|nr:uncharacterized protein LOC130654842 [Hydractinia symbiolongicarpus]XP_057313467.1 uncharacterized protein LOC130654842 [Hydractinia symbiolongicarpus]